MTWKPNDLIALIIATTICLLILSVIYNGVINGVKLSDFKANLVSGIIGSLITVLAQHIAKKEQ